MLKTNSSSSKGKSKVVKQKSERKKRLYRIGTGCQRKTEMPPKKKKKREIKKGMRPTKYIKGDARCFPRSNNKLDNIEQMNNC